jgi:hypothetical protein
MKKLVFSLLALTVGIVALKAQTTVIADANAKVRLLNGSFTAITVSDGVELYITQGNEETIAVSASDDAILQRFKTEVVNGTLKIYFDHKGLDWINNRKRKLTAYVSFKTLEKLHASGGASVKAKNTIEAGDLEMDFSSGSRFDGSINAKTLDIDQSSGSGMDLSGKAGKLKIDASSGARFQGFGMEVDYCNAEATSGGSVRIGVNKELTGKASSGGSVRYKGTAVIHDIDVSSGGIVKRA